MKSMTTPTTQPDDRCEQIAREIIPPWDPYCHELQSKVASALQSKQDEINELREEVLKVLSNLIRACDGLAEQQAMPDDHYEQPLRAALALRDKLKASQPTSPQPQTPHQ